MQASGHVLDDLAVGARCFKRAPQPCNSTHGDLDIEWQHSIVWSNN